jgi:hypothetical protein
MNFAPSQTTNTFLQQRPPPAFTTDCFFTYTRISSLCKPIDQIADSIDPFELANNPNKIPSSNIAQDIHQSVATLHNIQKSVKVNTNKSNHLTLHNNQFHNSQPSPFFKHNIILLL